MLTLEIPSGATPVGTEVTIESLDRVAFDSEPLDPDARSPNVVYEMLPDGLQFESPVTLADRVPAGDPTAVPLATAFLESDGELEAVAQPDLVHPAVVPLVEEVPGDHRNRQRTASWPRGSSRVA